MLKFMIFQIADIEPIQQTLYFRNQVLAQGTKKLREYGITEGSTLFIAKNESGELDLSEVAGSQRHAPERGFAGSKLVSAKKEESWKCECGNSNAANAAQCELCSKLPVSQHTWQCGAVSSLRAGVFFFR
jgi:hypothetical protein